MTDKKMTNRKIQALETKNKIYNIGLELIRKEGFDNISTNKICKEAGISVGLFYHYFKSKDDIIIEAYSKTKEYYIQIADNLVSENAADKIVEVFAFMGEYVADARVDLITQVYKSLLTTESNFFLSIARLLSKILNNIILEGQDKKELCNDLSAEEISENLIFLARGIIYDWCLHKGSYDIVKKMTTSMCFFIKNIRLWKFEFMVMIHSFYISTNEKPPKILAFATFPAVFYDRAHCSRPRKG